MNSTSTVNARITVSSSATNTCAFVIAMGASLQHEINGERTGKTE